MTTEDIKLTEEKIDECRKIFEEFDKDRDGTISVLELAEALKIIGCKANEIELNQILKEFDKDGSGHLEFPEFLQIVTININESNTEEELFEAFKIIDRDQDGLIACSDLIMLMTSVGDKLSMAEAEAIMKEFDPKGEGVIRYVDLMRNKSGNK